MVAPPLVGGGWILYYFHNRQIVVTPPIGGKGMIIDQFAKIILIIGEWAFSQREFLIKSIFFKN